MSLGSLLDRLRGLPIERDLSAYRDVLAQVSALEPAMAGLTDPALTEQARALRVRAPEGDLPDSLLPEAF
ncbi:MAG TPA: hypothetical protein VLF95_05455, partial [Vicinamibacteria bacterium]|nr:hypothetical protein [Vicinamibacteria bacterium]